MAWSEKATTPTDSDREIANQLLSDFCDGGMDYDQFRFAIAEAIAEARGRVPAIDAAAQVDKVHVVAGVASSAVDGDAQRDAGIEEAANIVMQFGVRHYTAEEVAARIRSLKRLK